jgi:methylenetetrahydrofolate dehydrogenase (NADP+)/methenyltetrahydrofolate cyclohydrolase
MHMETLVMSGRPVADAYKEQIKEKVEAAQKSGKKVTLAILTVGQDPASFVYRKRLLKITESLGIGSRCVELPETATTEETVAAIRKLNEDPDVTGILPMMPMPKQVDGDAVGAALAPEKDMDCLNPANGGALLMGKGRWAACTPRACMAMLKFYKIPLDGKHAVVLGRSNVVGKPVALLLLQENCTVTVCHSHTKNLPELVRQADIVVAAIGKAGFVTPDMVKPGAVIVDVGINVTETGIVGDVAPEATEKASAFTPVPGGVGVVSNVMMMDAVVRDL